MKRKVAKGQRDQEVAELRHYETIADVRFWGFLDVFVKIQCLTQIHILLRVGDLRQNFLS